MSESVQVQWGNAASTGSYDRRRHHPDTVRGHDSRPRKAANLHPDGQFHQAPARPRGRVPYCCAGGSPHPSLRRRLFSSALCPVCHRS